MLKKKSKDYYLLFIRTIAQFPKNSQHLNQLFSLSEDQLNEMFLLPHEVSFEPYMKAFQYEVLNSILFTNTKLCKFYIPDNKCSFCKSEPETLNHVFFNCRHARHFWKEFERYYYSLTREFVHLTLKDVIQYWDNKRTMPLAKLFDTDCKI